MCIRHVPHLLCVDVLVVVLMLMVTVLVAGVVLLRHHQLARVRPGPAAVQEVGNLVRQADGFDTYGHLQRRCEGLKRGTWLLSTL
jgi:hypothetical protein